MTERLSARLITMLNWVAMVVSLGWIGAIGGIDLMVSTVFRLWLGNTYSVRGAFWLEAMLFGPTVLLWMAVLVVQWLIRCRQSVLPVKLAGTMRGLLSGAELLFGHGGFRILIVMCLLWPMVTEIPGLLASIGLDPDRASQMSVVVFMAMFIAPPAVVAATILAVT